MAEVTDPTETSQLLGNSSSAQPDYNTTAIDPSQADNERNDSGFSEDPCIGPLSNIKKYRRTKTLSNRLSTSAQQRSFRDQSYSYKQSWLQSLKRQSRLLSVDASSRISKPSREPLVIFKDLLDLLLFHNVPGPMLFRLREEFNTLLGYGRTFQTFGVSEPRILNALTQVGNVLNRRRDKPQADERPLEGLEKKLKSLQAVAVKRSYADSPVYGNIDAAFSAESSTRAFGQQLYFVEREIENLCHPRIRGHPNIVRLLGWGLCLDTLEDPRADSPRIPLLIVERAHSSLTAFIKDYPIRGDTITTYEIYRKICLDVGRGIEAIHDLGLIHGDVKLDNILLFSKDGKRTAKLSDFGLTSAAGPEPGTRDTPEYKGTPRWTPPPGSACYQLDQLYQFDLFAYGLVVWCAFTGRTRSPMPPDEAINGGPFSPDELYDTAIQSLANSKWNSDDEMSQNIFDWCSESDQNRLKKVLRCCLHNDSRFWRRRPWKFFDKKKYPTVGPVIGNATLLIDLSQYFRRGKAQCMRRVATAEDKCGAVVNNVWKPVKHFASNISAQVLKHPIAIVRTLLSSLFADRSLVIRAPRSSTRRKQIEEISRQFRDSLNLSLDATSIAFLVHGIDAPCLSYKLLLQELETAISRLPPPKQAERLSIPRGEIQRLNDHTYALARICSRIPLCCFKHSAYDGNLVAQALQRDCNFSTLVWLCRGDVGNFQVSNLDVRTLTYWLSLVRPPQRTRTRSSDTLSRFILLCERGCRINRRVAGQQKSVLRVMLEVLGPRSQEGEYFLQFLVQLQKYAAGPESAASMPHPLRYFLTGQGIPDHLGEPPMEETAEYWTTALHECVKIPYYAAVEALVFAGFEVNSLDGQARTASQYAYELQPISRDDQRRKAILLEKDRILGLLRQHPTKVWEPGSLGDRSSQTTLPLGWDVHHIEGIYNDLVPFPEDIEVFQDRHFGSVTLKKPRFSFFSDQRLALGFRKVNIPGQTYYMDLLRFIIRQSTLPDPAMPIEWIFLDTWYEEEAARNDAVHVIRVYNRPMADGQNNRPIIVAYRRFTSSVSRRLHWMFPKFMGFIVSIPQVLNKFFGIGAGILTAIIRIPFVLFKGLFAMLIRSCLSRAFNILSVFVPLSCVAYARNWHYEYKIIFSLLALMYISDMIRIALAYLQGPQTDKFHGQDLFSTMCSVHLEVFIGALLIQRNVPQLFFPLLIGSLLWNMQFQLFCRLTNFCSVHLEELITYSRVAWRWTAQCNHKADCAGSPIHTCCGEEKSAALWLNFCALTVLLYIGPSTPSDSPGSTSTVINHCVALTLLVTSTIGFCCLVLMSKINARPIDVPSLGPSGIVVLKLFIGFLETLDLMDFYNAPVFHNSPIKNKRTQALLITAISCLLALSYFCCTTLISITLERGFRLQTLLLFCLVPVVSRIAILYDVLGKHSSRMTELGPSATFDYQYFPAGWYFVLNHQNLTIWCVLYPIMSIVMWAKGRPLSFRSPGLDFIHLTTVLLVFVHGLYLGYRSKLFSWLVVKLMIIHGFGFLAYQLVLISKGKEWHWIT